MNPIFFKDQWAFREWLNENHNKEKELWLGYYKKNSGKQNYTWSESVDQALCYGWIDGIRKSIDDECYMIRFTPRKPNSIWSAVNIKKIEELTKKNLMQEAGEKAYAKMKDDKTKVYSFEQNEIALSKEYEQRIKAYPKAWEYFQNRAKSYKKSSVWWVMSAKKEETQLRRLNKLIECSENGEKLPQFISKKKK